MDTSDENYQIIHASSGTTDLDEINSEEVRRHGTCQRILIIVKSITLEPCIFIYFLAMSMESLLYAEMVLQKTCSIHFNYSFTICTNLSEYKEEQILVENAANHILMYSELIRSLPTILFVLFLGPWSDKHGRKIPLTLPFIGCTVSALIMGLNSAFWTLPPEYILFATIPTALTGGMTCLIMSMYAYISDISKIRSRTTRIAFFDTFLMLGPSCGLFLSSVTKDHIGFSGTYIVTGCLYFISFIYIIIRIKETRGIHAMNDLEEELIPKPEKRFLDFFNCKNIQQTFKVTFEERPNYGRRKIIMLMIAICLMVFAFSGLSTEFLYAKLKLNWDYNQYVYWSVTAIGIEVLGMAIIFPLLSYVMNVRDEFLALIGCTSVIGSNLIKAFSVVGYQMYIANCIGIMGNVPLAISRSMASKIIPGEDSGKVFSVLGSWESFLPLVASPLYTYTYSSSISYFPGLFLVISASLYFFCGLIYMGVYWLNRRSDWSSLQSD